MSPERVVVIGSPDSSSREPSIRICPSRGGMVGLNSLALDERFLSSGDEAGTAPDDRRFRPDVEGLRAGRRPARRLLSRRGPRVTGGFIGVDVFFVISGFVITGLLLRERRASGRTSILDFYARRVRRILPAATLVIVVTVAASYFVLGFVSGTSSPTTGAGRRSSSPISTSRRSGRITSRPSSLPPRCRTSGRSRSRSSSTSSIRPCSWSWPAKGRLSLRAKMAIVLVVVIVASYWFSIVQTASQPTSAYFSPFTRAWELALGALVAVGTPWLGGCRRRWRRCSPGADWPPSWPPPSPSPTRPPIRGRSSRSPSSARRSSSPGVWRHRARREPLLRLGPFQWFGKRSYALYLWHWPILVIAAEQAGTSSLPLRDNLWLILLAIGSRWRPTAWSRTPSATGSCPRGPPSLRASPPQ